MPPAKTGGVFFCYYWFLLLLGEEDVLSDGVDLGNVEAGKVLDALYHVAVHGLDHLGDRTPIGQPYYRQVYGRLRLADLRGDGAGASTPPKTRLKSSPVVGEVLPGMVSRLARLSLARLLRPPELPTRRCCSLRRRL